MRKTCRNCKHSNYTPENFAEVTKACGFCGIYLANWEPKEDVPDINDGKIDELIRKQDAIDATTETVFVEYEDTDPCKEEKIITQTKAAIRDRIKALPPVQPNHNAEVSKMEIVRCKDCKHWNLQVGNVKGDGLGSCDFHNVNLVTGEGFCYWAEKRGNKDGTD